jgi:hypothetical protein
MFVLTLPSPLEGGEQDLAHPAPPNHFFFVFMLAFLIALPPYAVLLLCIVL